MGAALKRLQMSVNEVIDAQLQPYLDRLPKHDDYKIIRDSIWGFHRLEPAFLLLLDSPLVQRLRHIYQTALSIHTYPTASHSRFEHSLGVYTAADRMLNAISLNNPKAIVEPKERFEVLAAALLHDTGHGPFSHASEDVYKHSPIFQQIKDEDKARFLNAAEAEILTYCVLKSPAFGILWDSVARQAEDIGLDDDSIERMGAMIMGNDAVLPASMKPLRKIVNGPFDADKLDYIRRDGYFTGLNISVDFDRLLYGLSIAKISDDSGPPVAELVINRSCISALEQVIFAKAQLYTQLYHQHKVRAAARLIRKLIESCENEDFAGRSLRDPATYLTLDDYDMLRQSYKSDEANALVLRIKNRVLPRRALVIAYQSVEKDRGAESGANWGRLRRQLLDNPSRASEAENWIAGKASVLPGNVMVDIPKGPKLGGTENATIQLSKSQFAPLGKFFPAESWAAAHEAYRNVTYVFADDGTNLKKIARAAQSWMTENGIQINDEAFRMAKLDPPTRPAKASARKKTAANR